MSFVSALENDYLECRTIRHSWSIEYLGVAEDLLEADDIPFGYKSAPMRVLECDRCGMQRHDFLVGSSRRPVALGGLAAYSVFARRYKPPKGYLFPGGGEDRPDYYDYQRELFARATSAPKTSKQQTA